MTKKPINGINCLVQFYENGQWWIYGCARSASLQVNVETIETSVSGSGIWATYLPTKNTWSGTLEGLMTTTDNSALTIADLLSRCINHNEMRVNFQYQDALHNTISVQGYCYFTGVTQQASFDNVATFNINLIGTGSLVQSYTPIAQPTPLMYRYEFTASGGETGFTDPALINKQIIFASKDGIGNAKVVTGTPASKEVKYVVSTGQLEWAIPFETGEIAVIGYQNL